MIRLLWLLAALTFLPLSSQALEETRWRRSGSRTEFWILHQEGPRFFLDQFVRNDGDLQDRIRSLSFIDEVQAKIRFQAVTAGFSNHKPDLPAALTKLGDAVTPPAETPILWPITNEWNETWEERFRTWIEQNADASFLESHGVATDCADVAYAYRWIFARINGLPMANHLVGSDDLFTNESIRKAWLTLPTHTLWDQDRRFMAALNYVLDNTFTHSLMNELYPVAITPTQMSGGAVFLDLWAPETGHTQMVRTLLTQETENPGPLRMLASDVPRALRALDEYAFSDHEGDPMPDLRGFFRFRWARKTAAGWEVVPADQMPGYSLEQFTPAFLDGYDSLNQAVLARVMTGWKPNYAHAMRMYVEEIKDKLNARRRIVEDGFAFCLSGDCTPGTKAWDVWSTPARDAAVAGLASTATNMYVQPGCDRACKSQLETHKKDEVLSVDGRSVRLWDVMWKIIRKKCSSDPRDPIARRWCLN
jgi:hypothetical protein